MRPSHNKETNMFLLKMLPKSTAATFALILALVILIAVVPGLLF